MNFKAEYEAKIIKEYNTFKYFIEFIDSKKSYQSIEVSKIIFLQFFGVHSHDLGSDLFSIRYRNQGIIITQEMTKEEYTQYKSFKSLQIREKSVFDRYIEHLELSETQLFKRSVKRDVTVIDSIYCDDLNKSLYKAISELPKIQKKRLLLHYFNGFSLANIAKMEQCSKSSIQCSIAIAICTLKERMKKYF